MFQRPSRWVRPMRLHYQGLRAQNEHINRHQLPLPGLGLGGCQNTKLPPCSLLLTTSDASTPEAHRHNPSPPSLCRPPIQQHHFPAVPCCAAARSSSSGAADPEARVDCVAAGTADVPAATMGEATSDRDKYKIFIGGLSFAATSDDVYEAFREAGKIIDVNVVTDADGKSKGYGFVSFDTEKSFQYAMDRVSIRACDAAQGRRGCAHPVGVDVGDPENQRRRQVVLLYRSAPTPLCCCCCYCHAMQLSAISIRGRTVNLSQARSMEQRAAGRAGGDTAAAADRGGGGSGRAALPRNYDTDAGDARAFGGARSKGCRLTVYNLPDTYTWRCGAGLRGTRTPGGRLDACRPRPGRA